MRNETVILKEPTSHKIEYPGTLTEGEMSKVATLQMIVRELQCVLMCKFPLMMFFHLL